MEEILGQIFKFLQENRTYNKTLQESHYRSVIIPFDNVEDRVVSLLYHIANTQSQPKIDSLATFYKKIYQNLECLNSFESFINKIKPNNSTEISYTGLYQSIKSQPGFGGKTAALFVKSIFHLHNGKFSEELQFWNDVPVRIERGDDFYLPVDSVIISVFKKLDNNKNWNFDNINAKLHEYYHGEAIEIWDDLWFWGFITQNGSGERRIFQWNENKYWALQETDKHQYEIDLIKSKAEMFLKICSK
jgi:hypothetical protein